MDESEIRISFDPSSSGSYRDGIIIYGRRAGKSQALRDFERAIASIQGSSSGRIYYGSDSKPWTEVDRKSKRVQADVVGIRTEVYQGSLEGEVSREQRQLPSGES